MKTITFFYLTIFFLIDNVSANDGVFYAQGNTLIPLEETRIELKKERLILTEESGNLQVNVYFEFYNPDNEVNKLIGFVTPPADGALRDSERSHPHIKDFKVVFNHQNLNYEITRIDSSGFKSYYNNFNGEDFIYFFNATFKNGLNIIEHTYSYSGSINSHPATPGPFYNYRLTTGNSWANNQIDDFELQIRFNNESYFSVPAMFNMTDIIDWQLEGNGKIGSINNKSGTRNIKIKNGYIWFRKRNFKPEFDLSIRVKNPIAEINDFADIFFRSIYSNPRELNELTDSELRILRNTFYALRGYKFKSADLLDYFLKYDWYYPDPNIASSSVVLVGWHKNMVQQILDIEEKRKNKQ